MIFVKAEVDSVLIGVKRMPEIAIDIDAPGLGSGQTIAIENSGTLFRGAADGLE